MRTFQLNLLFRSFTVRDNVAHAFQLQRRTGPVGAFFRPRRVRDEESHFLERADEVLEHLGMTDRRDQYARQLSYGWQKTLTLAIGLAAQPKLLLLDEPITGIAPTRVDAIGDLIRDANEQGTTICLIEHNVSIALGVADHVYILRNGGIVFEGSPDSFSADEFTKRIYLAG